MNLWRCSFFIPRDYSPWPCVYTGAVSPTLLHTYVCGKSYRNTREHRGRRSYRHTDRHRRTHITTLPNDITTVNSISSINGVDRYRVMCTELGPWCVWHTGWCLTSVSCVPSSMVRVTQWIVSDLSSCHSVKITYWGDCWPQGRQGEECK